MNPEVIAVDVAKNVFEIAVSRHPGKVAERSPAQVLLEACGSSHNWAKRIEALGHQVRLLPPHLVHPYVTRNKTDRSDAKALLEAFRNDEIRPVPVKTELQHTLAALHRLRSAWVRTRTSRLNTLRGLLRELGITIPLGAKHVVPAVRELVEDADSCLSDPVRLVFFEACQEIQALEERIETARDQLEAISKSLPTVQALQSIPGVGLLTSTALVGFVGDIQRFPSSRHFASYLGLTPREYSSGQKRRLGRISKRGDRYLRTLLVHGGRAFLAAAARKPLESRLHVWALELKERSGHNKAAVAVANKLARMSWAVWKTGGVFEPQPA